MLFRSGLRGVPEVLDHRGRVGQASHTRCDISSEVEVPRHHGDLGRRGLLLGHRNRAGRPGSVRRTDPQQGNAQSTRGQQTTHRASQSEWAGVHCQETKKSGSRNPIVALASGRAPIALHEPNATGAQLCSEPGIVDSGHDHTHTQFLQGLVHHRHDLKTGREQVLAELHPGELHE